MRVFLDSVEESSLRRWGTALWKQSRPGGGRFILQMRQNSLNHRRIFNASNDLDLTCAPLSGLDVDIEHPLESLHPGHRRMALDRRLVQPVFPGSLTRFSPPTPLADVTRMQNLLLGANTP